NPQGVRIERALAGVKMRLAIPIAAYRGVVLSREDKLERQFYRLSLDHSDADLSVTLARANDIAVLVDQWSNWARFFAMPALLAENIGTPPARRAMRRPSRRRTLVRAKRPRARTRGRAARLACAPKIISAERELFSRE
ncbi:MAG: DUF6101 family protein, partial [Methylovirgula sp.]|nr:DUF6101 family protein [Methylovirgula sp.]